MVSVGSMALRCEMVSELRLLGWVNGAGSIEMFLQLNIKLPTSPPMKTEVQSEQ